MPFLNAHNKVLIEASDPVLTKKVPMRDEIIPTAAINKGKTILGLSYAGLAPTAAAVAVAIAIVAIIEDAYDSKRSDPIPATSPTLSPTLSAIVAGLRGSSSGIPASTLPTMSDPTSAALVNMPPPTRANSAMVEAPNPKPATTEMS